MKPDDPLLRILACPLDKGPLHLLTADDGEGEALYNPRLRRRYPVVGGGPPRRAACRGRVAGGGYLRRGAPAGGAPGGAPRAG
ncbi:Trm112 family protein, partial [Streptomyces albogriseolus]|uniref:Trm112 family protein n=1 Tax=Streptomyces albogriseolus TaxID=1887 RepID=UPI003698F350